MSTHRAEIKDQPLAVATPEPLAAKKMARTVMHRVRPRSPWFLLPQAHEFQAPQGFVRRRRTPCLASTQWLRLDVATQRR